MSQSRLIDRIKEEAKKPKEARDEKALYSFAREGFDELQATTVINVNAVNSDNDTALILAINNGFFDVANLLLEQSGINVNHKNNKGETALAWAVGCRNEKLINALIEKNAAVDNIDNNGISILRDAGIYFPELIPKIIERLHLIDAKSEVKADVKADVKEITSPVEYISHLIIGIVAATRPLVEGKDFYKQALEEFVKAKKAISKPLSGDTELFFTTLDKLPKGRKEDFTCNALEVISQFYDLAKSKDTWIAHGSVAILYLLVRDFQDIIIKGPEGKLLNNLLKDIYSDSSIKLSPHIFNQKESFEGYENVSIASFKKQWVIALGELINFATSDRLGKEYIATAYLQLALCETELAKEEAAHDEKRIEYLRKSLISFDAVKPKTKPILARMDFLANLPEVKSDEKCKEIYDQIPYYRKQVKLDADFERVKEDQKKAQTPLQLREYRGKYKMLVKGYCELRDEKQLEECINQLELLRSVNLFLGNDLFLLNEIILTACEAMLTRLIELNNSIKLDWCKKCLTRLEEKSLHPMEHQRLQNAIAKSKRFLALGNDISSSLEGHSKQRDEFANKGYIIAIYLQFHYHLYYRCGRNRGRILLNGARILIAKYGEESKKAEALHELKKSKDPVAKWYLNLVEDLDAINKDNSRIDINPTTLILLMLEKEKDPNIVKAITRSLKSSRVTDQVKHELLKNSDFEQWLGNQIITYRASKSPAVGEGEAKKTQGWGEYLSFWKKKAVPPPSDQPMELDSHKKQPSSPGDKK